MFPTLIEIGGYPINWYPVLMALSVVIGGWVVLRVGGGKGYDKAMLFDLCWWLVVGGLVGARLTFIIVDFEDQYYNACFDIEAYNLAFPTNPLTESDCGRLLRWWNGGLVFYGSVIGGILTMIWFVRREGVRFLPIADIIIPMLALGQFFGRIGCLSAGCCWGRPTAGDWGIQFPRGSSVFFQHYNQGLVDASATASAHVHATQIYDSLYGLFLFGFLLWLSRRKTWDGQVFFGWLMLYPLGRSTVELFRGDDLERGFLFEWVVEPLNTLLGLPLESPTFLSTSQFISLAMVLVGLLLWHRQTKSNEALETTAAPPNSERKGWYVRTYEFGVLWPIGLWGIAGIVFYFMTEPYGNDELFAAILLAIVAWYRFGPRPKEKVSETINENSSTTVNDD